MDILKQSNRDITDILGDLKSDSDKGLDQLDAEKRLEENGLNKIEEKNSKALKIFLGQFKSPFVYLLIAASILSFFLGQIIEGAMILLFIVINTSLGFFQEYKSENTIKLLKNYISFKTKVIRGGKERLIDSESLVVGDIVILETGDKINADLRIIEAYDLFVDESVLTGESLLVSKQGEIMTEKPENYFSASNICFSGTSVAKGKAKGVILAIGKTTFLGSVSRLTSQVKRVSEFEKGISKFSSFILKLVLITLVFVFIANSFLKGGNNFWELLIFSIALAISVIPEALPLVMTFSFSNGAMNLAKRKVVVKRLSSVEDLGNIDILCSDKTGTLTENKLTVLDFYNSTSSVKNILLYANLASSQSGDRSEPFDIALFNKLDEDDKELLAEFDFMFSTPFDPARQRNNVLVQKNKKLDFIVRGAAEAIFGLCLNIDNKKIDDMRAWIKEQGLLGRRVLAVAKKTVKEIELDILKNNLIEEENNLDFLGLIAFADPIKEGVKKAVIDARKLGVDLRIITGDSLEVAGAVAYQIGLISDPYQVILAGDLDKMSEEDKKNAIEKYKVFARVLPEQKFSIIKNLEEKYSIGYLGDGINDAPALKIAGVSIVVSNASDIARETADIVLLESDLNVIIEGIREGRRIFANSAKYIKATLASNFGNFYAVAIASLLIDFLPMLPLQILLLNLLSDFPMIAVATDNVDSEELVSPKKYQVKDIIIVAMILGVVSSIFDFMFFAMFFSISPGVLQTNWFIASILTELAFLFSIRTKKPIFKAKRPSNLIILLTGLASIVTVIIPFTSWGQALFGFVRPSWWHLFLIFVVAILYLVCSEIVKLAYYKNQEKKLV
ncbi:cation-transporting ATPase [Candidatus Falkowbacteria bacterium HGW-Falkowbacteria-1]|jgi:Mg2+-importing ATPase|uniref:Cation-transporting ATPase n=1 Tax=Candidatus Falkowbacteria bacterium HGW-Falkowbacteria-1 TaxID=2013768 RepID=A0A2N2EAC0_9BACT|nr:MAG: cation-transporting ATPase [Candidatus Falkowbacteria bacterium HGW-Falkowbacteria-1]